MLNNREVNSGQKMEISRDSDLIFLNNILRFFVVRKIIIALGVLSGVVCAAIWMRVATPIYEARMLVLPNLSQGSTPSNVENVASITGLDLQSGTAMQSYYQFSASLQSVRIAEILQKQHDFLRTIFAADWNTKTSTWRPHNPLMVRMREVLTGRGWHPPTADDLAKFLHESLDIEEDRTSHMLTITLRSANPILALNLLKNCYSTAEQMLRGDALTITKLNVAYIESKLETASPNYNQRALSALLGYYTQQLILLQNDEIPYAVILVDPPNINLTPVKPRFFPVLMAFIIINCTLFCILQQLRKRFLGSYK